MRCRRQSIKDCADALAEFPRAHEVVHDSCLRQVLRLLDSPWQVLPAQGSHGSRTGKADERPGHGEGHVPEGAIGCQYGSERRVHEVDDEGEALPSIASSRACHPRHLNEPEHPLLHAGPTGGRHCQ